MNATERQLATQDTPWSEQNAEVSTHQSLWHAATMPAESFADVLARLDSIIALTIREQNRVGYFAALYRHVAIAFKTAIDKKIYQNPELMERLDVIFFNRYLNALQRYQTYQPPTRAWLVAFQAARQPRPITLQHLLLGMNAHINFDLAISVAETCALGDLPRLYPDFNRMNDILLGLFADIQRDLVRIWPMLRLIDRFADPLEHEMIAFSMRRARAFAWQFASVLSQADEAARADEIAAADKLVATIGHAIWRPLPPASFMFDFVRLGERDTVARTIDMLLHRRR